MHVRLFFLLFALITLTSSKSDEIIAEQREMTFLEVDLVCGAASNMGCGSRSKPILVDLEEQPEISEAWLNRVGTVIAVVWETDEEVDETLLKGLIKKHKKSGSILGQKKAQTQVQQFKSARWYRTTEVDELSIEEAGRIAEMVVSAIKDQGSLSDPDAPLMQAEVEEFIKNELLNLEDVKLLDQRSYYKEWETGIKNIAKSYMHESEANKIHLFIMSP